MSKGQSTVFRVELDLEGALLLRRALDRESRVMGDNGERKRSGILETVKALDGLIERLSASTPLREVVGKAAGAVIQGSGV